MKKSKFCLFVIIVLIITTLVPRLYFYDVNQGYWWDEAVYLGLAKNLYEGKGYWINFPGQEAFRPLLFAHLIAGVWLISGISESVVKFLPPLFSILSILLIYFFTKRLYNKEVGIWSAFILACSHVFLFYSEKLLTESLFVFLGIAALYLYYVALEDDKKYLLPLVGVLTALAFLTRYAGVIFIVFYIIYPIFKKTKNQSQLKFYKTYKNWGFWVGIILFLLLLIPWFNLNIMNFGSPTGALSTGLGTVTTGFYLGEWYFYFLHWFEAFGLVGIFAIPGLVALVVKRENPNTLLLLMFILSMIFFFLIPRKELRYLIHFFQIYIIMTALGITEFRKWIRSRKIIPIIAIVLCFLNLFAGIQMVQDDIYAGSSLKNAGSWLAGIIPENTKIMSHNVPPLYYTTGKEIIYFPAEKENLLKNINKNNVSFIVIESREPTYPDYVWYIDKSKEGWDKYPSDFMKQFTLMKVFNETFAGKNKPYVWVYKTN